MQCFIVEFNMCHLSPWNCVGIHIRFWNVYPQGTLTKPHEEWCAFNCVSSICFDLVKQLVIFHLFSIVLSFFSFFVLCRLFESDFWNPKSCFKINFSKFEVKPAVDWLRVFVCIGFDHSEWRSNLDEQILSTGFPTSPWCRGKIENLRSDWAEVNS